MILREIDRGGGGKTYSKTLRFSSNTRKWSRRCSVLSIQVLTAVWLVLSFAGLADSQSITDNMEGNNIFPVNELCRGVRRGQMTRVIMGALIVSNAERELKCEVTFQTDSMLQKFMIRFEKLELDCNDHLKIYDSAYSTGTPLKDLSCRDTLNKVKTIYTHSNHVTLKYVTDEWGPLTYGFRLIITAFKHEKNNCPDFRCQNTNFCISRSLMCDSVDHCGDGSDESNSLANCPSPPLGELLQLSAGIIGAIGGVIGCVILLIAIVFVTVICLRRRRANVLRLRQQMHGASDYQMNQTEQYGTNGTYGTVISEKPPPYPGLPQHTDLDSSPGNLMCPALVDRVLTLWCQGVEEVGHLLLPLLLH